MIYSWVERRLHGDRVCWFWIGSQHRCVWSRPNVSVPLYRCVSMFGALVCDYIIPFARPFVHSVDIVHQVQQQQAHNARWRQCRQQEANKQDTSESREVHPKWFREKDARINKYGAKEMEQSSCISPKAMWFVRNKKANQTNYNIVDDKDVRDEADVEISTDQYS